MISTFLYANSFPKDLVCSKVKKSEVEKMLGKKIKFAKPGKLPIEPIYNLSFCEYINKVLPEFSIYYYGGTENLDSCIPPFYKKREIKNLDFKAAVVIDPESNQIFELISETKDGVISFVFANGLNDNNYTKALNFMKKLRKRFK
jgi:hypothetical protein